MFLYSKFMVCLVCRIFYCFLFRQRYHNDCFVSCFRVMYADCVQRNDNQISQEHEKYESFYQNCYNCNCFCFYTNSDCSPYPVCTEWNTGTCSEYKWQKYAGAFTVLYFMADDCRKTKYTGISFLMRNRQVRSIFYEVL